MSCFRFSPHRIVPAAVGLTAACALGLSSTTAQAATPVVHAGEDTRLLVARAAAATKKDPVDMVPLTFLEMSMGKPALIVGGGRVEMCRGAASQVSGIAEALDRADRALLFMENDKALAHLEMGAAGLTCLNAPVDPDVAAQLHFLRGVVAFGDGDELLARDSFARAHPFDADMQWDNNYAPDGKELFTEARIDPAVTIALKVIPAPSDGVVWIDGRRVVAEDGLVQVSHGSHLIQVAGAQFQTLAIKVKEGAESLELIVPSLMPIEAALWVTEPAQRPVVDHVLASMYDPHTLTVFSASGAMYSHSVGTEEWEELRVPSGFAGGGGRIIAGRVITWTGATVMTGGVGLAAASYLQARSAMRSGADTTKWDVYGEAKTDYNSAVDRLKIGRYVAAGGFVVTGGGLAMSLSGKF